MLKSINLEYLKFSLAVINCKIVTATLIKVVFIIIKLVFHLANLFVRTSKKQMRLAGDVISACRQPIKLLFSLFARTNSPSGKQALDHSF